MSIRYSALALTALLAGPLQAAELSIKVTGFDQAQGFAMIAVYPNAPSMETGVGIAVLKLAVTEELKVEASVDLPVGRYAIAVFHDTNSNEELDTDLVGMPSEPFGFGNDALGSFGPPNFDAAAVELTETGAQSHIEVR